MSHLLEVQRAMLKSRCRDAKCSRGWPCKRMNCPTCLARRRRFFLAGGLLLIKKRGLAWHIVVSWPMSDEEEDIWAKLIRCSARLGKALAGVKAGPYIRALGVGGEGCPHVHYIAGKVTGDVIYNKAHSLWPIAGSVLVHRKALYDAQGLLGYFFDRNFVPAVLDTLRPRRVRLLSASRPMRCGFPKYRDERAMKGERHG
jgi:hypothetical protein